MRTPSLQEFKRWSREHYALAYAVVAAQAFAQCERARVDAYIAPIFERHTFNVCERFAKSPPERITNIGNLYLTDLEAPDYLAFLAECDAANRAHGWTGQDGFCPALVAEHEATKAERALIDAGRELMGIEQDLYGDNRAKMLRLLLEMCLSRKAA